MGRNIGRICECVLLAMCLVWIGNDNIYANTFQEFTLEQEEVQESASVENKEVEDSGQAESLKQKASTYWEQIDWKLRQGTGNYGESTLSEQGKEVYALVKEEAARFQLTDCEAKKITTKNDKLVYYTEEIEIGQYNLSEEELEKIVFAFEADHPIFYWYDGCSYRFEEKDGVRKIKSFMLKVAEDYIQFDERKKATKKLQENTSSIFSEIDRKKREGASEFELELYCHNIILDYVDYEYDLEGNPSREMWAHNVIGVFDGDERGVVCEGYAKSFQFLLNYAGVDSIYVVGKGKNTGHAWNIVCLDGEWYNVDITWDDTNYSGNTVGAKYAYFNVTEEEFGSHNYCDLNGMYDIPKRTEQTIYNYYTYYNQQLEQTDFETVGQFISAITEAIQTVDKMDDPVLQLRFSNTEQSKFLEYFSQSKNEIQEIILQCGYTTKLPNQLYTYEINGANYIYLELDK